VFCVSFVVPNLSFGLFALKELARKQHHLEDFDLKMDAIFEARCSLGVRTAFPSVRTTFESIQTQKQSGCLVVCAG
jgi:hypothetical protein